VQIFCAAQVLNLREAQLSSTLPTETSMHTFGWSMLVQALVMLASAALMHALGARRNAAPQDPLNRMAAPLTWTHSGPMRWLPLGAGLAWWLLLWTDELLQTLARLQQPAWQTAALVALLLVTSGLLRWVGQRRHWSEMGTASLLALPGVTVLAGLDGLNHLASTAPWLPSHHGGWLAWPAALAWHAWLLRRWPKHWPKQHFATLLHMGGLWLFTALASLELSGQLALVSTPASSWSLLGGVVVVAGVLFGLGHPRLQRRWPLNTESPAYQAAAVPLALWGGLWLWWANVVSSGNATPLPYIPLLNPIELGMGLVATALLIWQRSLPPDSPLRLPRPLHTAAAASTGLATLTGVVLRSCHQLAGVPWNVYALWQSTLAQAMLSITWALSGVLAMLWANRRGSRKAWIAGAALLGVVVLKLFVVELADHGGLYRIVSFIGVGVLLLLVGYFAPVPNRDKATATATTATTTSSQE
jgi:hypothetical protein